MVKMNWDDYFFNLVKDRAYWFADYEEARQMLEIFQTRSQEMPESTKVQIREY